MPTNEEWVNQFFSKPGPEPEPEPVSSKIGDEEPSDLLGRFVNMANLGIGGAQLGTMVGGLPGGVLGGVAGAAGGAMLPPSRTPGTDIGATAAEILASRFLPGGGTLARRLLRIGGVPTAVGLGAWAGAEALDHETDFGQILVYGGASAAPLALGFLASKPSATAQAAARVKARTGVDIPLSASQATGRGRTLEEFFLTGTETEKNLAFQQSAAAQKAVEKIIGAPLSTSVQVILRGAELEDDIRKGIVKPWVKEWKKAHAQTVSRSTEVPTSVLDESDKPIVRVKTETKTVLPKEVDWSDFQSLFGLTREERDGFFRAIRTQPEAFIDQLIPAGENQLRGYLRLRGLLTVLHNSGNSAEAGHLASAMVMRLVRGPFTKEAVAGTQFAQRIENAAKHLEVALGSGRTEALRDVAEVLRTVEPLEKVTSKGASAVKRTTSYLQNKIIFTVASGAFGGGMSGGQSGGDIALVLLGGAAGAGIAIPASTLIAKIMASPTASKLMIAGSKGDMTAATKFLRSFISPKAEDREDASEPTSPRSRLEGLFKR